VGDVKDYLEQGCLLPDGKGRQCPFCTDRHALRLHGFYQRQALFPDPEGCHRIAVRRLLCARTGKTVSLLPDFCLPRRQHGPAILGLFITAVVLKGRGLLAGLRAVRADAPGHSVAQALWQGFLSRLPQLRTYLASLRPRVASAPCTVVALHRRVAPVALGLCEGFAFRHHGRGFHQHSHEGLA
jgi:hypothetical protein